MPGINKGQIGNPQKQHRRTWKYTRWFNEELEEKPTKEKTHKFEKEKTLNRDIE